MNLVLRGEGQEVKKALWFASIVQWLAILLPESDIYGNLLRTFLELVGGENKGD